jgi:hypothetical protein
VTDIDEAELARAWIAGVEADGDGRCVPADLIREFCRRRAGEVDPRGIRLRGAVVDGVLDLAGFEVPFPLRFAACTFTDEAVLHGARLSDLAFTDCDPLPGLLANEVQVARDLDLSGTRVTGSHRIDASGAAIWLCDADIGGVLRLIRTTLSPDGPRAIQADRLGVGRVAMRGLTATGEIRMRGAGIRGSVDIVGSEIEATGTAVDLGDASIGASLFLIEDAAADRIPRITGTLVLGRTRVAGELLIRNAILTAPAAEPPNPFYSMRRQSHAINASRLSVGALMTIEGETVVRGSIHLASAELGGLSVNHPVSLDAAGRTALDLTNAELRASVRILGGVPVRGTTRLDGAHIRGGLELVDAQLSDPEGTALLSADGMVVEGDVDLHHLTATGGQLKFWRATLESGLDATGASLTNEGGPTLRLHQATVKGSVRMVNGFSSVGYVMLNRSVIEGRLDCNHGTFHCGQSSQMNPGTHAIQAIATTARGGMAFGWHAVTPSIDLTDATTTVLEDDPKKWPAEFYISGFSYQRFDAPGVGTTSGIWDWRPRRAWLKKQVVYDAGPYEQAARVFRQHGYAYPAEQILIAQRADARRAPGSRRTVVGRTLDAAYGWVLGYGYRPGRVLWLLAMLLTLVSATLYLPAAQATMRASDERGDVYGTTGLLTPDPAVAGDVCGDGHVRCFQPVLYAIDTVVPLVSLDQRSTWYPNPHSPWGTALQWWLNIATVVGWLLSSIFLLSFARMARSA